MLHKLTLFIFLMITNTIYPKIMVLDSLNDARQLYLQTKLDNPCNNVTNTTWDYLRRFKDNGSFPAPIVGTDAHGDSMSLVLCETMEGFSFPTWYKLHSESFYYSEYNKRLEVCYNRGRMNWEKLIWPEHASDCSCDPAAVNQNEPVYAALAYSKYGTIPGYTDQNMKEVKFIFEGKVITQEGDFKIFC